MSEVEVKEKVARVPETEEQRAERLAKQEVVDKKSIYVGNVDYKSEPEQLQELFSDVGVIERVTILFDKFSGLPKGYAYIEFAEVESVEKAIESINGKEFRGREIRVSSKRTNVPGFRRGGFRGRGGRGRGGRGGRGRGSFRGRGGRGSSTETEGAEAPAESAKPVESTE